MRRQRVLITGISRFWGYELAHRLEADPLVEQIVGIDVREPAQDLTRTDFIRADLRHSLVGKLVRALGIDTVVHTNLIVDPRRTSARVAHETNVIGSMNLLAACSGADSPVRKLLVKSSTAIYGSEPDDPSVWTEEMTRRTPPRDAFSRDIVEVESYVHDFAVRQPAATVTVLRFANVLGPLLRTPFQTYFGLPAVPTVLGFDPRLQVLHEEDAVEALHRATVEDHPGAFNVAGPGAVVLSQAAHIMGRRCVPLVPPVGGGLAAAVTKRLGLLDWPPHLLRLIQYGRVVDVGHLRETFGWQPVRGSWQVLHDCAAGRCTPSVASVATWDGEQDVAAAGPPRPRVVQGAAGAERLAPV